MNKYYKNCWVFYDHSFYYKFFVDLFFKDFEDKLFQALLFPWNCLQKANWRQLKDARLAFFTLTCRKEVELTWYQ